MRRLIALHSTYSYLMNPGQLWLTPYFGKNIPIIWFLFYKYTRKYPICHCIIYLFHIRNGIPVKNPKNTAVFWHSQPISQIQQILPANTADQKVRFADSGSDVKLWHDVDNGGCTNGRRPACKVVCSFSSSDGCKLTQCGGGGVILSRCSGSVRAAFDIEFGVTIVRLNKGVSCTHSTLQKFVVFSYSGCFG